MGGGGVGREVVGVSMSSGFFLLSSGLDGVGGKRLMMVLYW